MVSSNGGRTRMGVECVESRGKLLKVQDRGGASICKGHEVFLGCMRMLRIIVIE